MMKNSGRNTIVEIMEWWPGVSPHVPMKNSATASGLWNWQLKRVKRQTGSEVVHWIPWRQHLPNPDNSMKPSVTNSKRWKTRNTKVRPEWISASGSNFTNRKDRFDK